MSVDDLARKEGVIHDAAMAIVSKHWVDKKYDGHPVLPVVVSCFDNSQEEEARQQEAMATFSSANMTALKSDPDLMAARKTYKFLMKHIDRRSHFLSYMKRSDKGCSHCSRRLITSQKSFALLQSSGGMFTQTQDPAHPGHQDVPADDQ